MGEMSKTAIKQEWRRKLAFSFPDGKQDRCSQVRSKIGRRLEVSGMNFCEFVFLYDGGSNKSVLLSLYLCFIDLISYG